MEPRGIGGLNPVLVNPAEEKSRMQQSQMYPDRAGSLNLVQRLRKLQHVRDTTVIRTPLLRSDDLRNPMNPNSPDWRPPSADVIVLPDGSQLNVVDLETPHDDPHDRRRRRRRAGD